VYILRGFALFGILFVNMTIFSHPMQAIVLPAERLGRSLTCLKLQPMKGEGSLHDRPYFFLPAL